MGFKVIMVVVSTIDEGVGKKKTKGWNSNYIEFCANWSFTPIEMKCIF